MVWHAIRLDADCHLACSLRAGDTQLPGPGTGTRCGKAL